MNSTWEFLREKYRILESNFSFVFIITNKNESRLLAQRIELKNTLVNLISRHFNLTKNNYENLKGFMTFIIFEIVDFIKTHQNGQHS